MSWPASRLSRREGQCIPLSCGSDTGDRSMSKRRRSHTRLDPTRHHYAVRSARYRHGAGDHSMQASAPTSRATLIPTQDRQERPQRPRRACRDGQLREPQASEGPYLDRPTSSLPCALHTRLLVVAESSRTSFRYLSCPQTTVVGLY